MGVPLQRGILLKAGKLPSAVENHLGKERVGFEEESRGPLLRGLRG